MSRNDDKELTPISVFLPGIVEGVTIRPPVAPPTVQGRHHYTRAKQIDALLDIPDGSAEFGFMTRLFMLCCLPRTDQKDKQQYKRENGPWKLGIVAGIDNKLPYGNLPRLLLAWVCTEAYKTKSRDLQLGQSLAAFMRQLGMLSDSGGSRADRTRLRDQMDRLFNAHVQMVSNTPGRKSTISSNVTDSTDLWWDYKTPMQNTLWHSSIRLGEHLFDEIMNYPVPVDMQILKVMRRSSLGLDLYLWLSYKTHSLYTMGKKPQRLSWVSLYEQFGSDPSRSHDPVVVDSFRKDALRELKKLKLCWPTLTYATPKGCLEVRPSMPSIPPKPKALPKASQGA